MIADLHCHYPMHLLADDPEGLRMLPARRRGKDVDLTLEHMLIVRNRRRRLNKLRAAILVFAARLINFRRFGGTWRVSLDRLESGEVRVVLSVLYVPWAEIDLDEWFHAKPDDSYFGKLMERLRQVERDLGTQDENDERKIIVKSSAQLESALSRKKVAMIHCVEGGFHLGPRPDKIEERVAELAQQGVAYITLAHLFFREVATNAPALPFLPDFVYDAIFFQRPGEGLTPLGEEAVKAMYRHRILIDVSHMRQAALDDTFALLGCLDKQTGADPRDYPVIATHAGYRFGHQDYMLTRDTIEKIHKRDGVIGLIMARHQLYSGLGLHWRRDLPRTLRAIRRHVAKINRITKSYDNVAIGSDLDGFIKPTVGGIENVDDLRKLEPFVRKEFPEAAEDILHGNAVRVLRKAFSGRP